MTRTLVVTNDFPPRPGGIQAFVHELARRLSAEELVVYAPAWRGAAAFDAALPFPVVRHPTSLMLPVPDVARRAVAIAKSHACEAVWFGAAAPKKALSQPCRRTSSAAARAVARVGSSMPVGRRTTGYGSPAS